MPFEPAPGHQGRDQRDELSCRCLQNLTRQRISTGGNRFDQWGQLRHPVEGPPEKPVWDLTPVPQSKMGQNGIHERRGRPATVHRPRCSGQRPPADIGSSSLIVEPGAPAPGANDAAVRHPAGGYTPSARNKHHQRQFRSKAIERQIEVAAHADPNTGPVAFEKFLQAARPHRRSRSRQPCTKDLDCFLRQIRAAQSRADRGRHFLCGSPKTQANWIRGSTPLACQDCSGGIENHYFRLGAAPVYANEQT